ncbi:hypothetical protein V8C37DRAFT_5544 [Trichoderma ceciliae]
MIVSETISIDPSRRCRPTVASLHVTTIVSCVTGILIQPIKVDLSWYSGVTGFQVTMPSRHSISPCFTLRHISSST